MMPSSESSEIAALPTPRATAPQAMRWQRRGAPQMVSLGFAEPIDAFAPKIENLASIRFAKIDKTMPGTTIPTVRRGRCALRRMKQAPD